ncbi:MAG: hypothetical protein AABX33_03245 [Nanoarchaeota archaeon]
MITQKVLYDRQVGKDELVRLYADYFWNRILSTRSFSYRSKGGGGFADIGCSASPEDIGKKVMKISEQVEACEMERQFLGYLGPTTRVAFRNTNDACEVTLVGSYDNLRNIRQVLDQNMGAPSDILYIHRHKELFDTRINSYFGGRVTGMEWGQKLRQLDDLSAALTGMPLITKQDFEAYRKSINFQRDVDFKPLVRGNGEVSLSVGGTYFEPSREIPQRNTGHGIGKIGFGIELILRGTRESVKKGFDDSVEHLGYPLRVEVPLLPIPFLDYLLASMNEDYSQTTNVLGWITAKKVIREKGAKLLIKVDSICKFPYNLFLLEIEGKVVKDGKVLDPRWDWRNAADSEVRICGLKPSHDSGVDVCPLCAQSASNIIA